MPVDICVCVEWSFMPVDIFKVSVLSGDLCLLISVSVLTASESETITTCNQSNSDLTFTFETYCLQRSVYCKA